MSFDSKVLPKLDVIKKDPYIDVYSLGHSCIQRLQVISKCMPEELPHPSEDLKLYSDEVTQDLYFLNYKNIISFNNDYV